MARLFQTGFEFQSVGAGVEIDGTAGPVAPAIDTTTKRTGAASLKINTTAGNQSIILHQYRAAASTKVFARFYLFITSYPGAETSIFGFANSGNTDQGGGVNLLTNGTLQLLTGSPGFSHIGSPSAVLSLSTWYRVELSYDDSVAGNTVTGFLDGTQFATGNGTDMATTAVSFYFGDNDGNGLTMFTDDIAINDTTGSFQTGLPGAGQIVHLKPSAAGDNNAWTVAVGGTAGSTNNFTRVNETTPDDATSYNGDVTATDTDDFNMDDTPSSIAAGDTINVVMVLVRYRALVAAAEAAFKVRIKKAASGTVSSSAEITPNATTWKSNANAVPITSPLITYQDPDSGNWTKTTLDSSQAGYNISTTNTNAANISTLHISVDSTPVTGGVKAWRTLMHVGQAVVLLTTSLIASIFR